MSVLVLSHYGDIHAVAIEWGLKQAGVDTAMLTPSDLPHFGTAAVTIDGSRARIDADGETITDRDWGVIWNRRRGRFSPDQRRSAGETRYVEFETRQMVNGVFALLETLYPMVNRFSTEFMAANKVYQLAIAAKLGLTVPRTVVGNAPSAVIEAFVDEPPAFKCFRVPVWEGSDIFVEGSDRPRALIGMTTKLERRHLDEAASIMACPAIYQAYVEKAYELRVLWLDGDYVAAKIHSQATERSRLDWRGDAFRVELEPVTLDADVRDDLTRLMAALGLDTGSIDLIVTPKGETVFLEVNPTGQFLWLDSQDDRFDAYGAMIRFLIAKAGLSADGRHIPAYRDFAACPIYKGWLTDMDPHRFALHTDTRYSDDAKSKAVV